MRMFDRTSRRYSRNGELPLLTTSEVAEALTVSIGTVRRLVRGGHLSQIRIGGSVRFRRNDVLELIARGLAPEKSEEPAGTPALLRHADAGGGHGTG